MGNNVEFNRPKLRDLHTSSSWRRKNTITLGVLGLSELALAFAFDKKTSFPDGTILSRENARRRKLSTQEVQDKKAEEQKGQVGPDIVAFKINLQKEGRQGIVLDIDETLANAVLYFFDQLRTIAGVSKEDAHLSSEELIAKYHYAQFVPYWKDNPVANEWMHNARNSNAVQEGELPIEGSVEMVNEVAKIVPIVGYITVRPPEVLEGTTNWLRKHGFPDIPLIFKPNDVSHADGTQWKAKSLHYLYPEVIGIVDDSVKLIQDLPAEYQGTIYLYGQGKSPREDIHVVPAETWGEMYQQIQKTTAK
ncbi:MAG TPA: hypothetical protein VEW42_02370 [Candidatus Eisenbacteria bacterium]|nr:hypothetical protein [Candidatus Eisenbacteria bacterium]